MANKGKTLVMRDWDELYKEFIASGMSKARFLRSKGIDTTHVAARAWTTKVWKAKAALKEAMQDREADTPKQLADLLGIVETWSMGLAQKHYNAANMLRVHAEIYIEKNLEIKGGQITGTQLSPRDMNALATVLSSCQKMERLALGLSTENVAANHSAPTAPAAGAGEPANTDNTMEAETNEPRGAVFIVEVNQDGKFMRPRPRLQLQAVEKKSATG